MSFTDIIGSAAKKLRPSRKDKTRSAIVVTAGIATAVIPHAGKSREAFDGEIDMALRAANIELVVLAGFMRILGPRVVGGFKIVNTHPALLPAFPGAHAVRDALAAGAAATGVTVHWVDEGVDTGPVIAQVEVPVEPGDDEANLRERVQAAEKPLYVTTLRRLCQEFA